MRPDSTELPSPGPMDTGPPGRAAAHARAHEREQAQAGELWGRAATRIRRQRIRMRSEPDAELV